MACIRMPIGATVLQQEFSVYTACRLKAWHSIAWIPQMLMPNMESIKEGKRYMKILKQYCISRSALQEFTIETEPEV